MNPMKTFCVLFALVALLSSATAQPTALPRFQFGLIGGIAPARIMGTAPVIVNRHDEAPDFLFNGSKVEFSPALGLAVKLNTTHFFFESGATYYSIRKSYAMEYINGVNIGPDDKHEMEESCKSIEVPLSAGVKLGYFQIKSGFTARYEFGHASSLSEMGDLSREMQSTVFGWHSGIGINLGKVSAELQYQQDFANYGQGIFVNGQELLLRNSPTQLRFRVGLWF